MIDLDLFGGAGGLALGMRAAGFSPIQVYEKDPTACETLRYNSETNPATLPVNVIEGDVREVDWKRFTGSVRLLAAGAPCQPFSLGGKHRAQDDDRNLFPEVLRAVRSLHPKAILIENVQGLLRKEFQHFFEYLLRQLECPGLVQTKTESWREHDARIRRHQCSTGYVPEYHVSWRLLEAADFGVPQIRKRMFIVATAMGLPVYRFPSITHSREALVKAQAQGAYWATHGIKKPRQLSVPTKLEKGSALLPWVTVRDALVGLPMAVSDEEDAWMNHWIIPGAREYPGHSGSSLDWPSKTIKAGVHGVPGGENTVVDDDGRFRYYTLREAARIQTFPDQHYFKGARIHITRQLGNAVPCLLATKVAVPLFHFLAQSQRETGAAYASV
jgi:DNA (cytosine-5)-methyltransferase 1